MKWKMVVVYVMKWGEGGVELWYDGFGDEDG